MYTNEAHGHHLNISFKGKMRNRLSDNFDGR